MRRFAGIGSSSMLKPPTEISPAEGGMNPVIIRMVVDLPAPFGPRKPSTSPFSTVKETPFTATFGPNAFCRLRTVIMPGEPVRAGTYEHGRADFKRFVRIAQI